MPEAGRDLRRAAAPQREASPPAGPRAAGGPERGRALPPGFEPRALLRRAVHVLVLLGALVLVALLAPGLGEVRRHLGDARPAWIALAVAFELLSCLSYVLMFRPVFCRRMSWRHSARIAWSELGAGSLVPASGAAGLALGAWALIQGGMAPERVARRSVAFFVIKSAVNFVAVAVLGTLLAVGLLGPDLPLWLTAGPAALSALAVAAVVALPLVGPGRPPGPGAGRPRRAVAAVRRSVIDGVAEAVAIVRSGDLRVLAGSVGYWLWDNAVLWAAFHALGVPIDPAVVLLGYLIGQLGGLLPIPGGVGGIDGGLIGMLILLGAPAAASAAAVLAYRVILFWLPLLGGAVAFWSLRRQLARGGADVFAPC